MNIDQIISDKISEQVALSIEAHLNGIVSIISDQISTPEFEKWGRYLPPKKAMIYTGYSSLNGFKEMCRLRNIKPIEINKRVLKYDRYELDKINIQTSVKEYLASIH